MIAAPSRIDHLRRFVAWVLDLEPDRVADMSEERAYRILAGERRHDPQHIEHLRALNTRGLEREAPFAASYWRGHPLTLESLEVRAAPRDDDRARWAEPTLEAARAAIDSARQGRPHEAPEVPQAPRATPDELRELLSPDAARDLLERAHAHTPAPVVGLR